ncbi:TPA: DUF308 domain-containing protein [Candidatus Ventrenecus avicola]|nr:DUF308 domain-containing protein [Candidatus Ventrenecus avicola]
MTLLENKAIIENIKKSCKESFIAAFLLIVFAIVLLINPENFMSSAINVFGYIGVFFGVINLVIYFRIPKEKRLYSTNFRNGLLLFLSGIIAFFKTEILTDMITIIIGGYLIFRNVDRSNMAMMLQNDTKKLWIFILVTSIINILIGLFIAINPFDNWVSLKTLLAILIMVSEGIIVIQNLVVLLGVHPKEKVIEEK